MFILRPRSIVTVMGFVIGVALLFSSNDLLTWNFTEILVRHLPNNTRFPLQLLIFLAMCMTGGWICGYCYEKGAAFCVRKNINLFFGGTLILTGAAGAVLAYLCLFTFWQGAVFTSAILLFVIWVSEEMGSEFGPLTENDFIGLLVAVGFVAALALSFTSVLRTGSIMPERPVSCLIMILLFLPYAIKRVFGLLWN